MTTTQLDESRLADFGERIGTVINHGFLSLSVSLGHRTGLFDTMAGRPPATGDEIAAAAGLDERYVREVLGALVTGDIVEYDPVGRTYSLPAEHAAFLTRAAGVMNLGAITQFVPMLGAVEDDVVHCFQEGGGVPYSRYPTFQRVMAELAAVTADAVLIDVVVELVAGLRERLEAGIDVAEIGCGSGYALNLLARAFPKSRFVGLDLAQEAIAAARQQAREWGSTNIAFEARDGRELAGSFDLVTAFDVIHDLADPDGMLRIIAAALRDDGAFLCADIAASSHLEENRDHPMAPCIYTISTMHCMTVSLAQGGAGLGAAWGEQTATRMLRDAGFATVRTEHVEGDPINVYYVATKR